MELTEDLDLVPSADADFCILAGDLADLGQAAAYRRLQAILGKLAISTEPRDGGYLVDEPDAQAIFTHLEEAIPGARVAFV